MTATSGGSNTNYNLATSTVYDSQQFTSASFNGSNPTKLTGGADTKYTPVSDAGTISLSVGGLTVSVPYGQGSTGASLSAAMAALLNAPGSDVFATANGAALSILAQDPGPQGDYAMSWTGATAKPQLFSQPSFGLSLSGIALTGGTAPTPPSLATSPMVTLYTYDMLGNLTCVEQHGNVTGTGCSSPPISDATSP